MNEPVQQPATGNDQPPAVASRPNPFLRFLKVLAMSIGVLVAGWFGFPYLLVYLFWG